MLKDNLIDFDPVTGKCANRPRQVFLELTPRCNLACVHCPKDYGRDHPDDRDMPAAILDAAVPWIRDAKTVNLNLVGEPLIADQFHRALTMCSEQGVPAAFNTNGIALTAAACEHIAASNVSSVVISVDGLETHESVRGVPFATIERRIAQLDKARNHNPGSKLQIGVAYTLMRRNMHELPRVLKRLMSTARIDFVHVQPLIVFWNCLRAQNIYFQSEVDSIIRRSKQIALEHGSSLTFFRSRFDTDEGESPDSDGLQLGQRSARFGCSDPFYEVKILASGKIQSCSWGLSCGVNILDQDVESIWNGEYYTSLRRKLYTRNPDPTCFKCPFVFGSAAIQESQLRKDTDHSHAERFRSGAIGKIPTDLPAITPGDFSRSTNSVPIARVYRPEELM
jgi:MoaA/NifB/PqqE/SkfB family radical SAM enzyme